MIHENSPKNLNSHSNTDPRSWLFRFRFIFFFIFTILVACYGLSAIPWRSYNIGVSLYSTDVRRIILLITTGFALYLWKSKALQSLLAILTDYRLPWVVLALFFIAAQVSVVIQTYAFRFPMFDTGIYHQPIWHAAQGHGFIASISGAGNYLLDHLAWSFVLFMPIMKWTGGAPWTLPVLQVTLIFTGFAAWVWFAKKLIDAPNGTDKAFPLLPLAVASFCCFFGSVWENIWWGFHDTAICFAAWSWFMALLLQPVRSKSNKHFLLLVVLLVVGACAKESALIEGCGLAIVAFFVAKKEGESRVRRLLWLSLALVFVLVLYWFEIQPKPSDKNYFDRYYSYLGHGIHEVVLTLLTDPLRPIRVLGWKSFASFGFDLLWPWLGLPIYLFSQRCAMRTYGGLCLIGFLPGLGLLMLSTNPHLRGTEFHYVLSIWPVLALMTIATLARLQKFWLLGLWVFVSCWCQSKDVPENTRLSLRDIAQYGRDELVVRDIPIDAKISAVERSGAWLAKFPNVTRWPDLSIFNNICPDYLFIHAADKDASSQNPQCFAKALQLTKLRNKTWTRYQLIYDEEKMKAGIR